MIIEMSILSIGFLIVGFILGVNLGKSDDPKFEAPEWYQNLKDMIGM